MPVRPGYGAQIYYNGADWDARFWFPDVSEVRPGDHARSLVAFLSPEEHRGRMHPGLQFKIREGQREVGSGVVERVLAL